MFFSTLDNYKTFILKIHHRLKLDRTKCDKIKYVLISSPVLPTLDLDWDIGVVATLFHNDVEPQLHVVCYVLKKLPECQKKI